MTEIPGNPWLDSTLALAKDGYRFISGRCDRYQSDLFQTRLMFKKAVCMRGEEAAKLFYDTNLFRRQGAMPQRVQKTLLGQGGVQGLDGETHRHRKQALMSLMTSTSIRTLCDAVTEQWQSAIQKWEKSDQVELFYEANEILCRATCAWAGVPLRESDVKETTEDFMAIISAAGAVGPRHWRGRRTRTRLDNWLVDIIEQVRAGTLQPPEHSAASTIAAYRESDGKLLDAKIAAVELNNMIRPTIATARFFTFAALALHEHPQYRERLRADDDHELSLFVQEVRRYYPFFPSVAAIAKQDIDWQGYHIPKGQWVMLDLYGTNHDSRTWKDPDTFRPERFHSWDGSPFNFIPQGGGDHHQNHRCAGEWITIEIMKVALRMLTQAMDYEVPPQDLQIKLSRLPAIPESRFVMNRVRGRPLPAATEAKSPHTESAH